MGQLIHCSGVALGLLVSVTAFGQNIETYVSARLNGDGNIAIITSDQRTIVLRREGRATLADGSKSEPQTSFGKPAISDDHQAVGAQAEFPNCCTSYDIPLQLVVYAEGKVHRFQGGLAIFDWHFVDGGQRVAFSQQPVHFACAVHWELRDVSTERLLAATDLPEPCGQIPNPAPVTPPAWVLGTTSGIR